MNKMTTRDIIMTLTEYINPNDLIVCSLGRTAEESFLNIDNIDRVLFLDCMGAVTGTAIGVSLGCPENNVFAFETDGSLMYNLSIFHTLAYKQHEIKNLNIIIFDNELLESGGGEVSRLVNFNWIEYANSWGIDLSVVYEIEDLKKRLNDETQHKSLCVIVVKINNQNLPQTCFKDIDGIESKYRFKRFINKNINKNILRPAIKN